MSLDTRLCPEIQAPPFEVCPEPEWDAGPNVYPMFGWVDGRPWGEVTVLFELIRRDDWPRVRCVVPEPEPMVLFRRVP